MAKIVFKKLIKKVNKKTNNNINMSTKNITPSRKMHTRKQLNSKALVRKPKLVGKFKVIRKVKLVGKKQNPKQQLHLKQQFRQRPQKKRLPPDQRIWRKTIVRTKFKEPQKVPKMFRIDEMTGLPINYERTVERVMHYVNPRLTPKNSPEQLLEQVLTDLFVDVVQRCGGRTSQSMLGHQIIAESFRRDTQEQLSEFHYATKLPPMEQEPRRPTYQSKFNYNKLKIRS